MRKNVKKSKGIKNLVTVRELKTWLDGYCSAHGVGWSPTPEQWEMIRDKIFSLQEGEATPYTGQFESPYVVAPLQSLPNGPVPRASMSAVMPQSLPPPPQQFMTSEGDALSSPPHSMVGATDRPAIIHKDGKFKTPDKLDAGGPSDFA